MEENIIIPMMPDKVVESFRRNIWEDERELEGNLELGFTMYTYMKANKHAFVGL